MVRAFPITLSGLTTSDGVTLSDIEIPDDIYNFAKGFLGIENDDDAVDVLNQVLAQNGITSDFLEEQGIDVGRASEDLNNWWNTQGESEWGPTIEALSGGEGGADASALVRELADAARKSAINTQSQQNVYAEAWIGTLIPGAHFGIGVNAGVSTLDISSVQKVASALQQAGSAVDLSGITSLGDTFIFPTLTADARIGAIFLPFDIGFAAMMLDTTKIGFLNDRIKPVQVNYQSLGGDIRYAILKGKDKGPKWSVAAGFYYTKGGFSYLPEDADVGGTLNFEAYTGKLETQFSWKATVLVPFAGARLVGSWATADLDLVLNTSTPADSESNTQTANPLDVLKLLGGKIGAKSESFSFHPQIFLGIGLDLAVFNLIVNGCFDFATGVASCGANIRIAW